MTTVNAIHKGQSRARPGHRFHFDYWLLLAVAGLLVIGMLVVYSTTFDVGLRFKDDPTYYFRRQFIAMLLGLAAIVVIMQFDYHFLRRLSVPILGLTLLLLVGILLFGEAIFGAKRGLVEGSYQPSEVA
ncbi:MAG: FtsW/RodA/SpoVE family cell cycle protein, partial [Chloroflexota bacterium]